MDLHYSRTTDLALVRSIIVSDLRLYGAMADDTCPPADDFQLPEDPGHWYVLVKDGDELLGFWALLPHGEGCAEVHTCLLPSTWGTRALAAGHGLTRWIWKNTPFTRLTTTVPRFHGTAIAFAKKNGMREFMVEEKRYPKYGTLHDLVHLEMHKPEGF